MSLSIYHTHTHSLGHMSERKDIGIKERDYYCQEIIVMFSGFTFGVDSISEEVVAFSPLWFPQGKLFVSLVSCVLLLCMLFSQSKDPKIIMLA